MKTSLKISCAMVALAALVGGVVLVAVAIFGLALVADAQGAVASEAACVAPVSSWLGASRDIEAYDFETTTISSDVYVVRGRVKATGESFTCRATWHGADGGHDPQDKSSYTLKIEYH